MPVPLEELEVLHATTLATAILETQDEQSHDVLPRLQTTKAKEGLVFAVFDLGEVLVPAYRDSHDRPLHLPRERTIVVRNETGVQAPDPTSASTAREPRRGSPIHSWRTLGLIDAAGIPTRRGEIFSFFQHGEGLAIAAALEDETYPLDDLVTHLANLRGGSKFDLAGRVYKNVPAPTNLPVPPHSIAETRITIGVDQKGAG